MRSLVFQSIVAGLLFGTWPLIMNKSKLSGSISPAIFTLVAFMTVLPFAIRNTQNSPADASWKVAVVAGIVGGIALILFNGMLAKATREQVSSLFVLAIVTQTVMPAAYQVYVTKTLPLGKGLGFLAALVAAILLA